MKGPGMNKRRGTGQGLVRTLGWFSIGLGVAELMMPRTMARGVGLSGAVGSRLSFLGKGVRETAVGIGVLTAPDPTPWLWARVGGDMLDLSTAVFAMLAGRRGGRAMATLAAVGGVTALDIACARVLSDVRLRQTRPLPDYSSRSGFPRGAPEARGVAKDFQAPRDMRVPDQMRPYA